jgi:hypothetical protein
MASFLGSIFHSNCEEVWAMMDAFYIINVKFEFSDGPGYKNSDDYVLIRLP